MQQRRVAGNNRATHGAKLEDTLERDRISYRLAELFMPGVEPQQRRQVVEELVLVRAD